MRILHLSDTHLPAQPGPDDDGLDARAILSGLLHDCRHLRVDLVVVSGDVSDDGSVPAYRDAKMIISDYAADRGAAVAFCPGNHDDRTAFADVLGTGHLDPAGAPSGRSLVDVDHGGAGGLAAVGDVDGLRVITLDSLVPGQTHGEMDERQLRGLRDELARPAPRGTVVVLHHPPIAVDSDFWRSVNLQRPEGLFDVVRGSDVRAVLCGHNHLQLTATVDGIPVWVGPGVITRIDLTVQPGSERAVRGAAATLIDLDAPNGPTFSLLQARDVRTGRQVYLVDQETGEASTEVSTDAWGEGSPTGPGGLTAKAYQPDDLAELVVLQRCCWVQEAIANDLLDIPALHETSEEVAAWAREWTVLCVRQDHRLVAAVRGRLQDNSWEIGRLMVAPDLAGQGLGRWLLAEIERHAPTGAGQFVLFTGARSERNLRLYQRAGYVLTDVPPGAPGHIPGAVFLIKPVNR